MPLTLPPPRQPPSPAHRSEPAVPPNASPSRRSSRDGPGTTSAPPPLCEEEAAGLDFFACGLEEEASELLLNSRRGQQWLDRVSEGLRVPLADRGLVRSRIRLLLMRGNVVARDWGVFDFLEAAVAALDRLEPDLWPVVFRESTSPKPILEELSPDVLERGIGAVGSIRIPDFIWHAVAPNDVLPVSTRALPGIRNISPEGLVMARALVRDGVLTRCPSNLPPNGWLFPVPKNSEKASMIVHLVQFNKQHANRPPSFTLPVVEDLAFLIELHYLRAGQGCLAFSEEVGRYLCDPFLRALDDLRLEAPEGAPLLACHVDLKNAFWSSRLPEAFKQAFRVSIDGQTFAFNCLPFGWQYSPVICQTVLGYLLQGLDLVSVLVLHYLDDFLVLGFGAGNVRSAAARLCDLLGREGAIISPKSILEPVPSIVWLGKQLVLSGAGQGVFVVPNQWIVLLGLWLRVALLPLSRKLA